MKVLKDILYKVSLLSVSGSTETSINGLFFDSRQVGEGTLFVATVGTAVDGHRFINTAIEKGAVAIVCQVMPKELLPHVTYIQVKDSAVALAIIASNYYGNPSSKIKLVGITGTNGKTTTVTMLYRLFIRLGYKCGMLSTVENRIDELVINSTHTTPDPISINHLLAKMVETGCTHCFMEVSSHAVVQHRIHGLTFKGGIFSNISHDHLDYHKTFDEYIKAKKGFFDQLGSNAFSLVNIDDKRGMVMVQNTKSKINTYALKSMADFKAKIISNTFSGLELEIDQQLVWFKLIGSFNAYNLLAIYGTAILLGEDKESVLTEMSLLESASGRFEKVVSPKGLNVIIDYAHTPDALENVLKTIQDIRQGSEKVITVVGCGGNRDTAKRPIMANIAVNYSDKVIFTSDNPRNESPDQIIKEMESGVSIVNIKKTISIVDRKEAIKTALSLSQPNDIILIAGKGHENYQEINNVKYDFDDKIIVKELINLLDV